MGHKKFIGWLNVFTALMWSFCLVSNLITHNNFLALINSICIVCNLIVAAGNLVPYYTEQNKKLKEEKLLNTLKMLEDAKKKKQEEIEKSFNFF
jgi:hypothetical protein